MLRFLTRRIAIMIPLIIGITFISFAAMSLIPGNFVANLALDPRISPRVLKQMEAEFGLDQPLMLRYARWLWGIAHLRLGVSLAYRVDVIHLIGPRVLNTVILALSSMALTWLLAIPIGIIVAVRQNSMLDRTLSFLSFLGMSVPAFFLAFLAIDFALWSGWFPIGQTMSPDYASLDLWSRIADRADHLILPTLVLGLAGVASLMRLMRSQILEIKNADYVRTARAKGLSHRRILWRHVLRNGLVPIVTILAVQAGQLLAGAIVIEAVFNWPGLGTLIVESIGNRDYAVIQAVLLLFVIFFVVINAAADVGYGLIDPRLRVQ